MSNPCGALLPERLVESSMDTGAGMCVLPYDHASAWHWDGDALTWSDTQWHFRGPTVCLEDEWKNVDQSKVAAFTESFEGLEVRRD